MWLKKFLIILSSYAFLASPVLGLETILFEDDFNSESTDRWIYNYDSFVNWDIKDGYVDLLNSEHPGFGHLVDYGYFVDLDGTNLDDSYPPLGAGAMESKQTFDFFPEYSYRLEFDLAGSQASWLPHVNTVTVSLGDIYNQVISLDTFEPFRTIQYPFNVTSPTSAKLIFDHLGNDQVGLLLDNVVIYSSPIIPTYTCAGFEPPCDDLSAPIQVKKNKCVPLKTELHDPDGFPITDTDIISPPIIAIVSRATGDSPSDTTTFDGLPPGEATDGIQFEFIGGRWCYNLKVKDYYIGPGIYEFQVMTGDENEYSIDDTNSIVTIVVEK